MMGIWRENLAVENINCCPIAATIKLRSIVDGTKPTEEPFGFVSTHIYTTVAHRYCVIFVPISAMKSVSCLGEERSLGDAGEYIGIDIRSKAAIAHMFGWHFFTDMKCACWGF